MKSLEQKIEDQKAAIYQKKSYLHHDYNALKEKLKSPKGMNLLTVGGLAIGFLLLPKKFKILKVALKAYTMAATLRGVLDLIPASQQPRIRKSRR